MRRQSLDCPMALCGFSLLNALKYCQTNNAKRTHVLPVPVAILRQYLAKSLPCISSNTALLLEGMSGITLLYRSPRLFTCKISWQ